MRAPRRPPQRHQYLKDVGRGRSGRLVRENLFDILTRSCGREQCADTGHLTNTLYIIHQQKPAPEEGCGAQLPGSAAAPRPERSDINLTLKCERNEKTYLESTPPQTSGERLRILSAPLTVCSAGVMSRPSWHKFKPSLNQRNRESFMETRRNLLRCVTTAKVV